MPDNIEREAERVHGAITKFINTRIKGVADHAVFVSREVAAVRKLVVEQEKAIRLQAQRIRALEFKLQVIDQRTAPPRKSVKL